MENTTLANVFINKTQEAFSQPPAGGKAKWFTPRNLFIILGVIILVELIFGLKTLLKPQSLTPTQQQTTPQAEKGKLMLLSDKKDLQVGEVVTASLEAFSPGRSVGIDAVIKFDPQVLALSDRDIHQGTIFPRYPLAKVEDTGVVRISGIATPGAAEFVGKAIFATVNFKALKPGTAKITLDFTPGSTADSNIVGNQGKDLLEEVGNLEVNIR